MTNQNPITPPPELVEHHWNTPRVGGDFAQEFAAFFAQWGADQELEACCEWITGQDWTWTSAQLRAARRPKLPSLKRVALLQLDTLNADLGLEGKGVDLSQIRRALEALDD